MLWFVVAVAFIFGLLFGSAINAMVWRLKVGRSWAKGRSVCPDCGHVLGPADLVPVLSWLMLGGKCRYCRKPIQDSPWVELVTGLVFGLSAYAFARAIPMPSTVQIGFWFVMVVMLIVLAVYDLKWMILPDKVMLPLIIVAFLNMVVLAILSRSTWILVDSLSAAVIAGGLFYLIVWFSKGRAMGGGDIKLAFCMGLILGVQSTLVALFIAFAVGALVGIGLMILKKKSRKDQIPFGPFLVSATVVAFLFGPAIVHWYLALNGLG